MGLHMQSQTTKHKATYRFRHCSMSVFILQIFSLYVNVLIVKLLCLLVTSLVWV